MSQAVSAGSVLPTSVPMPLASSCPRKAAGWIRICAFAHRWKDKMVCFHFRLRKIVCSFLNFAADFSRFCHCGNLAVQFSFLATWAVKGSKLFQ